MYTWEHVYLIETSVFLKNTVPVFVVCETRLLMRKVKQEEIKADVNV